MQDSPLLSCRVKFDRAYKHLRDLQRAVDTFSREHPNSIITDEKSEPGVKIDRFNLRDPIPPEFSAYIGDIAHNLVSALDSLATALVTFAGVEITEEVMRDTYFPINWEKGLTEPKSLRILEPVGPQAKELILQIEPYKRGKGHDLFRLWRLNVIDKHRAIVPVAADFVGVQFVLKSNAPPPRPRNIPRKRPRFPLKYGDELAPRTPDQPEYDAYANFVIQIAFGEGQVFEGESIIPRLKKLINLVEGTINIFATHIFKTSW